MSVTPDEVRRIADLAKLSLDDQEAARLTEEMNRILEHAEELRGVELPTGELRAVEGASEAADASEPASVGPLPGPDPLLRTPDAFAPEMNEGFFTVPPPPGVVASDS